MVRAWWQCSIQGSREVHSCILPGSDMTVEVSGSGGGTHPVELVKADTSKTKTEASAEGYHSRPARTLTLVSHFVLGQIVTP